MLPLTKIHSILMLTYLFLLTKIESDFANTQVQPQKSMAQSVRCLLLMLSNVLDYETWADPGLICRGQSSILLFRLAPLIKNKD
jgi:hypothetical protein